jgi:hypothetical protein
MARVLPSQAKGTAQPLGVPIGGGDHCGNGGVLDGGDYGKGYKMKVSIWWILKHRVAYILRLRNRKRV